MLRQELIFSNQKCTHVQDDTLALVPVACGEHWDTIGFACLVCGEERTTAHVFREDGVFANAYRLLNGPTSVSRRHWDTCKPGDKNMLFLLRLQEKRVYVEDDEYHRGDRVAFFPSYKQHPWHNKRLLSALKSEKIVFLLHPLATQIPLTPTKTGAEWTWNRDEPLIEFQPFGSPRYYIRR